MGKSFKKTKIFGNTSSKSEKEDKRICNRALRSKVKQQIKYGDPEAPFPTQEEVFAIWSMSKDGKGYWKSASKKDMRK